MRMLAALITGLLLQTSANASDLTVFAAASLTEVMEDVSDRFEATTGLDVALSFAGSSVLARQIRSGAPADIMVSANRIWMDYLDQAGGLAAGTRRVIAGNVLTLVTRRADEMAAVNLQDALDDGNARFALGDPDHVPVGIYARQSLTALGLWAAIGPRLVLSSSTRSAVAFVQRGAARYGIAYRTDALAFRDVHAVADFPISTHDPIRYEAAMTALAEMRNAENALKFMDYLASSSAKELLQKAGFTICKSGKC
jgi:molybdate transport system substrate-binding protein